MTGPEPLPISCADLLVVVNDLWDAAFSCGLNEVAPSPPGGDRWWAQVDLVAGGVPAVRVVAEADDRALRDGARMTFGLDEPGPSELEQVMAETANIVAGNVKGILRMGTELTLPRARQGRAAIPVDGWTVALHGGDEWDRHLSVYLADLRARREPGAGDQGAHGLAP